MKVRKDSGSPPVIHQGVAELGHELGNVLNGLLGMTRLVRDSGLNAEQEYWLRAIEQSGCQMRRLVDAFWLGPTQTGEFIHPNPVDLDGIELLEQALLAHAPAARRNADRLLLTVAPDVPRYWHCDPCLLRQLLDNLLGNALKFTRSGEVVLEVAARLQGNDPTDTLLLAVIDSGPGIDAALGRRMFRAYERGLDPGPGGLRRVWAWSVYLPAHRARTGWRDWLVQPRRRRSALRSDPARGPGGGPDEKNAANDAYPAVG